MSNRSKFADGIAALMGTTKKEGAELLQTFTEALARHMASEGEAVLPGFGRLKSQVRSARRGYNPKTGAEIDIPEKVVYKFKAFPKVTDAGTKG